MKTLMRNGMIAFVLLVLLAVFAVIERPTLAQCSRTTDEQTDEQIVTEIYDKIKGDKNLASQISHINVMSRYSAVKIHGWADSKSDYDKIVDFGMTAKCVKLLNISNFSPSPPSAESSLRSTSGCAAGTKPCGDICIPEADICNISLGRSKLEGRPGMTPMDIVSIFTGISMSW